MAEKRNSGHLDGRSTLPRAPTFEYRSSLFGELRPLHPQPKTALGWRAAIRTGCAPSADRRYPLSVLLLADQDGGTVCTRLLGMKRTGRKFARLPWLVGHGTVLGDEGELSAKHEGKSGKFVGVHIDDKIWFEFERFGRAVPLLLELLPELRFVHDLPLGCLVPSVLDSNAK